jgi:ribosomal protein S27AE
MSEAGKYFNEQIRHFSCGKCQKWWSIGDAPEKRNEWFCPWCGENQVLSKDKDHPLHKEA